MEERFDIYTREGVHLGVRSQKECHAKEPGFYHKPVWIWIVNSQNELLVQKRAACKRVQPNKWDMPSAGHVDAGETSLQGAVRETFEELGIATEESEYRFLFEHIEEAAWEIGQVFLLKKDIPVETMTLQEDEVAEVKWLTLPAFEALLFSEEFTPFSREYKERVLQALKAQLQP